MRTHPVQFCRKVDCPFNNSGIFVYYTHFLNENKNICFDHVPLFFQTEERRARGKNWLQEEVEQLLVLFEERMLAARQQPKVTDLVRLLADRGIQKKLVVVSINQHDSNLTHHVENMPDSTHADSFESESSQISDATHEWNTTLVSSRQIFQ